MIQHEQANHGESPAGAVIIEGDHARLEFERVLPHTPEVVWAALTEAEQLRGWFVHDVRIDAHAGGTVEMVTGPARMRWAGRILTWVPPRVLEYEWNLDPRDEAPHGEQSTVRWELTPEGAGTRLRLTHRRLTRPTAGGFAPGTHAFLDRLAAFLRGDPVPEWTQRYAAVQGQYRPHQSGQRTPAV